MIALAPVLEQLLAILHRLEIPYLIGGSIASGSYGLPRQTNDVDIVADFQRVDIAAFCALLMDEFYLDAQSAIKAIQEGRPFNVSRGWCPPDWKWGT